MDYKIVKTRTGWAVGDRSFATLDLAEDYIDRMEARGARRFGRSEEAASLFAGGRRSLLSKIPRKALGNLRGVVNPIKSPMAGVTNVHAAAGQVTNTIQVQQPIAAGSQLYAAGIGADDFLVSVSVDGKNIFTGGPIPGPSVNPATTNENAAPGLLIPVPITTSLTVVTQAAAARTIATYIVAPSIEVEAALDACECD